MPSLRFIIPNAKCGSVGICGFRFHISPHFSCSVRYIRVNEFTKTLRGFAKNFQSYQEKLEFTLVAQMAGGQVQISYDLGTIKSSIATLIDRVATPASEREAQALEYVRSHGGAQIVEVSVYVCHDTSMILMTLTA